MGVIVSAISLVIAAGFGAIRIWRTAKGEGNPVEKITAVHGELAKIVGKLDALALKTEPTWDDTLADVLAGALDVIAENVIDQLWE